jgi:hypothetical protein
MSIDTTTSMSTSHAKKWTISTSTGPCSAPAHRLLCGTDKREAGKRAQATMFEHWTEQEAGN